jgi:hypothetical protein
MTDRPTDPQPGGADTGLENLEAADPQDAPQIAEDLAEQLADELDRTSVPRPPEPQESS